MQHYQVTITGTTPLLMRRDALEADAMIQSWRKDPANRKRSIAGDDRSPAWAWLFALYRDETWVGLPQPAIMVALRDAAARMPTGRNRSTYKRESQASILVSEWLWPIEGPKGRIRWADLAGLFAEEDFAAHVTAAAAVGIDLFVCRARVGQSKHVRVRPRFLQWSATGRVTVLDEAISQHVLQTMFEIAGRYVGLGDWRPGAPKSPGQYGMFTVSVTPMD